MQFAIIRIKRSENELEINPKMVPFIKIIVVKYVKIVRCKVINIPKIRFEIDNSFAFS